MASLTPCSVCSPRKTERRNHGKRKGPPRRYLLRILTGSIHRYRLTFLLRRICMCHPQQFQYPVAAKAILTGAFRRARHHLPPLAFRRWIVTPILGVLLLLWSLRCPPMLALRRCCLLRLHGPLLHPLRQPQHSGWSQPSMSRSRNPLLARSPKNTIAFPVLETERRSWTSHRH